MSSLAAVAVVAGLILMALNLPFVVAPDAWRRQVVRFPRSRWPGWILAAVDVLWIGWVIWHAPLGRYEFLRPVVLPAVPVVYGLAVVFLDELLAPRALGGLLMLVANPVLNAARFHPSPWRLVAVVLAYVWVVAGMLLMLSPYRFRQVFDIMTRTLARCRWLGLVRALVGALLLVLGLTVY